MPSGSSCWRFHHEPPGNRIEPGRHAVHADVVARQLLRQRLREADLRGLHRVVGHAAAGLAAEDRRDHDDDAAAALPHVRHGQPRRANRREERLVERLLPVGVGGARAMLAAAGQADVVHEDVEAAEVRRRCASTTVVDALGRSRRLPRRRARAPGRRSVARTSRAALERARRPRAQIVTRQPSAASAVRAGEAEARGWSR